MPSPMRAPRALRLSAAALAAMLLSLALSAPATAQTECERISVDSAEAIHYRRLGDRCEGTIVPYFSATPLRVVSLTANAASLSSPPNGPVRLAWPAAGGDTVRVRVVTLDPAVSYRMDILRPGTEREYRWDTGQARRANATTVAFGAVAWTIRRIYGRRTVVYLPLSVGPALPRRTYELTLVPQEELETLHISVSRLNADGTAPIPLVTHRLLDLGPYAQQTPIRVSVPAVTVPGLYYVAVAGRRTNTEPGARAPALAEFWLLHPPRTP